MGELKRIVLITISLLAVLFIAACSPAEKSESAQENEFFEKIPVIDAYYNGEKIWFIHTDVTNQEMAEKLTKMVSYRTVYAPQNAEAIDKTKIAKFYIFTNGIDHAGVEPWNGGPFGFQIDIFESVPGDEMYTSVRMPYAVTWNENAKPRILKSVEELMAAETAGELTMESTDVIVNVPVVRWPGGSGKLN